MDHVTRAFREKKAGNLKVLKISATMFGRIWDVRLPTQFLELDRPVLTTLVLDRCIFDDPSNLNLDTLLSLEIFTSLRSKAEIQSSHSAPSAHFASQLSLIARCPNLRTLDLTSKSHYEDWVLQPGSLPSISLPHLELLTLTLNYAELKAWSDVAQVPRTATVTYTGRLFFLDAAKPYTELFTILTEGLIPSTTEPTSSSELSHHTPLVIGISDLSLVIGLESVTTMISFWPYIDRVEAMGQVWAQLSPLWAKLVPRAKSLRLLVPDSAEKSVNYRRAIECLTEFLKMATQVKYLLDCGMAALAMLIDIHTIRGDNSEVILPSLTHLRLGEREDTLEFFKTLRSKAMLQRFLDKRKEVGHAVESLALDASLVEELKDHLKDTFIVSEPK
ncbi:hypothetical protein CC1G_05611 [Coprinopsis cinerea okayama7|uniref:F-box domain-containing protein n=1 Tax=Coprinopsis cinerea (strain Okayama-7 / 130 / ATCC MYA-4618 / FGSC 9003) TaxID=240176 RepID=A8P1M2_COPC7|nr:hypothetical protein CC1G_05611 [Coprinopsis cinerea okayama7\|eukprot:XP_001838130.1 hypothetical protein CC1G_05611 [Coprinopsis cinerea okayama7\